MGCGYYGLGGFGYNYGYMPYNYMPYNYGYNFCNNYRGCGFSRCFGNMLGFNSRCGNRCCYNNGNFGYNNGNFCYNNGNYGY